MSTDPYVFAITPEACPHKLTKAPCDLGYMNAVAAILHWPRCLNPSSWPAVLCTRDDRRSWNGPGPLRFRNIQNILATTTRSSATTPSFLAF